MSLKNRNETKLLMENWRKVLKEGLYDEDPELLEEGILRTMKDAIMYAILGGAALAAHNQVDAKAPINQLQKAGYSSVLSDDKLRDKEEQSRNFLVNALAKGDLSGGSADQVSAMNLAMKLSSPDIKELNDEEMKILQRTVGEQAAWFANFKQRFANAKKEMEAAKEKARSFDTDDLTLGSGGELVDAELQAKFQGTIDAINDLKAEFNNKASDQGYVVEKSGNLLQLKNADGGVILSIDDIVDEEMTDLLDQGM